MDATLQFLHSWWAYLVVLVLVIATLNSLFSFFSKKEYGNNDFRISLFALIVTHLQLLIGLVLYIASDKIQALLSQGMGNAMGNSQARLSVLEHPLMMLIAVILITIGYSRHKKQRTSNSKFRTLAIFYTLGTLFVLSRIPWDLWFN